MTEGQRGHGEAEHCPNIPSPPRQDLCKILRVSPARGGNVRRTKGDATKQSVVPNIPSPARRERARVRVTGADKWTGQPKQPPRQSQTSTTPTSITCLRLHSKRAAKPSLTPAPASTPQPHPQHAAASPPISTCLPHEAPHHPPHPPTSPYPPA